MRGILLGSLDVNADAFGPEQVLVEVEALGRLSLLVSLVGGWNDFDVDGSIKAGEGVYGLTRAFQIAGSDYVMMSLFKVSDEATNKLMKYFSEFYEAEKDYRKAFRLAKLKLREEYPQPWLWGSFVITGA